MERTGGFLWSVFLCSISSTCERNILDVLNVVHENSHFMDKSCPHVDTGIRVTIRGNKWDNGLIGRPLGECG